MCAFCGSALGRPAFPYDLEWNGTRRTYRRCSACRTVTIDPIPTKRELQGVFAYASYHASELRDVADEAAERSIVALREGVPNARTLLDFGCGTGEFLRFATAAGYESAGVEYEAEAIARAAEASGVDVTSLEDMLGSGLTFDVIRLAEVLTAVGDPAALLRSLEPMLEPEGSFLIESGVELNPSISRWTVPAVSTVKRLLGQGSPAIRPPTLLWRTDRPTLIGFLERTTGSVVTYERLFDDGWPLLATDGSPSGPGERIKHGLGTVAASLSRGPAGKRLGNHVTVVLTSSRRGS